MLTTENFAPLRSYFTGQWSARDAPRYVNEVAACQIVSRHEAGGGHYSRDEVAAALDAWYELRTSGPDSTCANPISYPSRLNSSNSSGGT
jgi:hypothetical protein